MPDSHPTFNYTSNEFRLAIIAAPFAAAGQTYPVALNSAEDLLIASRNKLSEEAKWYEEEGPYAPIDLPTLRKRVKGSEKTLKSYVMEAFAYFDNSTPEKQKERGSELWRKLLAGEREIDPQLLWYIEGARAKRYAAPRKKRKK